MTNPITNPSRRLPVESAKKLRWFDQADLARMSVQHVREKHMLLDTIAALKKVTHCKFWLLPDPLDATSLVLQPILQASGLEDSWWLQALKAAVSLMLPVLQAPMS
jgi:hypothetical protein